MTNIKKRTALGLLGVAALVGGLPILAYTHARSYYHWLGASWHGGADLGAFMLAYLVVLLAGGAVVVAFLPWSDN